MSKTKFILGDIFIGNFKRSQGWGTNPAMYKQYGLAGHNGWDWATPNGTPIIAPADGECIKVAEERDAKGELSGYGRYCKVLCEQNGEYFVVIFGHLQSVEVNKGQKVKKFQLLALSNNTGNSTGPHVHFGIYLSDAQGNKIESNNYGGYHDPGDTTIIDWVIENPTKPYEPTMEESSGITPDAQKALEILETFRARENHGNLEGAIRSLIGSFEDLKNLKGNYDSLGEELTICNTLVDGQKETIKQLKKQDEEISIKLGTSGDFATVMGEIEKLIAVEDDNEVLRKAIKALKDTEGEEIGKIIIEWENKLKVETEKNLTLQNEIKELISKKKKGLDKYSFGEVMLYYSKKITNPLFLLWEKVKEGIKNEARGVK